MLTYHVNKSIKSSLDLHPSLIQSLLIFGLPVPDIFQLLCELHQLFFIPSLLYNHRLFQYPHLFFFFLIHDCELPYLMTLGILFLHSFPLGFFDLSELYLEQVFLMLDSEFLPFHELIGVLRIRQLPLRLIQLMLHQHLPIAVIRGVVVGSEACGIEHIMVVVNVGAGGHISGLLVGHEVVARVQKVRVLRHLMLLVGVVEHGRVVGGGAGLLGEDHRLLD